MNIPSWEEAEEMVKNDTATPLHVFVYNHEPAGKDDERFFRAQLQDLVNHVFTLGEFSEFDRMD